MSIPGINTKRTWIYRQQFYTFGKAVGSYPVHICSDSIIFKSLELLQAIEAYRALMLHVQRRVIQCVGVLQIYFNHRVMLQCISPEYDNPTLI